MKLLPASLILSSLIAASADAAAPKVAPKPAAVKKAAPPAARPGVKKPAASVAATKKDDALKASLAAKWQAGRLDGCPAFKANIADVVSSEHFAKVVGAYLGDLPERDFEKDEFETTAEFTARIRKTLAIYLGDPDRVVFKLPLSKKQLSYDADAELMTITLPKGVPAASLPGGYGKAFLQMYEKDIDRGGVQGVTRMGVKFRYDRYVRYEQFVALSYETLKGVYSFKVEMKRDEARAKINSLTLVMLGGIEEPYAETEDEEKAASLDSTYEQYTRSEAWYVVPRCIYVVDTKANAVLGAFLD
ncbi:MAG: hypothetical protein JWP92_932 [Caulobacter sp.]|nr:hypothetical protein [Caulobacter sp.]